MTRNENTRSWLSRRHRVERWESGVTRDLDTHWKLHWVLVSRQGLGIWMSFMTWIRLTVQWIVSDCDLGKVSVYTPSRDCVGLHMYVVGCVCV